MTPKSQDSAFDIDTFRARTQNVTRDSSPAPHARRRTETDFVAVGALFDRRASEPRPRSLDLSEGEETAWNSHQLASRAEPLSNADVVVAGGRILGRSPSTPTPTRRHLTSYIQPSDMIQVRRERMRSRRRRLHRGPGTQSSVDPLSERQGSDTSSDDANYHESDDDGRDRSTTPTHSTPQFIPPSYTPSHHSAQTEEEHAEGQAPLSPNPYSVYFPYNPLQQHRTQALEGVDEHFPVDQGPRAE